MGTNKWFLYIVVSWTILFAGMSFYWAMGGMIGVRSLGGAISMKSRAIVCSSCDVSIVLWTHLH